VKRVKKYLIFIFLFVWAELVSAQTFIYVNDNEGRPVAGAHVFINPLNGIEPVYEITDFAGKIKNTCTQPATIKISYVGFKSIVDTILPGADLNYTFQLDQNQLNEYIVTSYAIPTRIQESVYKVKVIDRARMDAQGAQNLRDLLTNDLNVRLSQDAVLGSSIKMQGVGGENVKIMVDGVPMIGRLDGNLDLSQVNLNNIEKIEIIEGSTSTIYGSNAMGGVINLITKKNQHHNLEGSTKFYYETVGTYNLDARVGWQFKNNFLQVSGGRYFFDGFNITDSIQRVFLWKPKEQYHGELQYNRSLGKLNLRYSGNLFHELLESKGAPETPFFITATDQWFRTIRSTHGLFLTGYVAPNHHIDLTFSYAYYQRRRQTFRKDLVSLNQHLTDENTDEFNQVMSRGMYNFNKPGARVAIQTGYEFNYETAQGPRIENQFQEMTDVALFAAAEIKPVKIWSIKPAMRFGYQSKFEMPVIPSIHTRLSPHKNLDIRLSYSSGFRAPTLKELYFLFVDVNHKVYGNPQLQAEYGNNLNGSITYTNKHYKNIEFGFSAGGFYNDIQNQIRLIALSITPDSNIYRNTNIARFQSVGAQATANFTWKNLSVGVGATYTGIINSLTDSTVDNSNYRFYPEIQTNAAYHFKKWHGKLSLFFKYTGTQPFLYSEYDEGQQKNVTREGSVAGFGTMDVSYSQSFFKNKLQIALYGKNLLNITNVAQVGVSGGAHSAGANSLPTLWGRSFGVSVTYNFIVRKK
jgi:outer membrane receptor for ferrienterochelin and colicins